jgi:hypothetical protein
MTEHFIRVAHRRSDSPPVPIFKGEPPSEICCSWLAVSHHPESSTNPETFVLYFLDPSGRMQEALQFDTLEAALDQGSSLAAVPRDAWRTCSVVAPEKRSALDFHSFSQ